MHYSAKMKESILKKIVSRGSETFGSICKENGVSLSTAYSWVAQSKKNTQESSESCKVDPAEKLDLVIEFFSCNPKEQGILLRKKGLFTSDLDRMKGELEMAVKGGKELKLKGDIKSLKEDKSKLKKQLQESLLSIRKKDKVIAETTALLVLKKSPESSFLEEEEHVTL